MTAIRTEPQLQLFSHGSENSARFADFCEALGPEPGGPLADHFGAALRRWAHSAIRSAIPTLSLFSGAGGLDIAFHDAGFQIGTMVEIEERFASSLKANCGKNAYLGHAEVLCCDIRNYRPDGNETIDFIVGGPPCQSFSAAGRRAAGVQGTDDARGGLFEEYVRLLKQFKPKGFLFENVYGITGAQQGKAWQQILDAFEGAGYHVSYRILDTADYGVPQHRERMFIVGATARPFKFPCPTHGPDSPDERPYVSASEAIHEAVVSDTERAARVKGRFGHLLDEIPPGLNYSFFTEQMGHPTPIFAWRSKFSDFLYKADPNSPIRTLKAQGGQYTGPFHWNNRPFSLGELKRLQTFPDAYEIVGNRQVAIHQIGNSVPPQIARILAIAILNQVFEVTLPSPLPLMERNEILGFRARKRSLTAVYRAKAQAAICTLGCKPKGQAIKGRKYAAALGEDFAWHVRRQHGAELLVEFKPTKVDWSFHITPIAPHAESEFSVEVSALSGVTWGLDVPKVSLYGTALMRDTFTGAWKAFEAELARLHIKADLVQLCGYYQYKPILRCTMSLPADPRIRWEWIALKRLVEGAGVGPIMRFEECAELWGIPHLKTLSFAKWLRTLGYEVRNSRTNPQIPEGHLLVPYTFPTLTPLSVQLRKSLSGVSNGREE